MDESPTTEKASAARIAHTPGPWRVDPLHSEDVQTEDGGLEIAGVSPGILLCGVKPEPQAQREANARLIAAAPDLLEACHGALTCMTALSNDPVNWPIAAHGIAAAIAKAEGRQP